jgi:hypothetical protein
MSKQPHRHQFGSDYMHSAGVQHVKNSRRNSAPQVSSGGHGQRNSGGGHMLTGAAVGAAVGGAMGGPAGMVVGALLGGFFSK